MLSRRPTMPSNARPRWDIFCNVIDNFGDIGVCWRLARQLAAEHGFPVRLWVNQLATFERICPEIDACLLCQSVQEVEVRHWGDDFDGIVPGDIVIETFACQLPEQYIQAMATQTPKPIWVNLDYLSAETWVSGCHQLPSPHSQLPLTKYFFFPGFDETTGGLLREHNLEEYRRVFCASAEKTNAFWDEIGQPPPAADAILVSLFSYENSSLRHLLDTWRQSPVPVCCIVPMTANLPTVEAFMGRRLNAGAVAQHSNLEIHVIPFVPQQTYDQLLWQCDLNCVRGEDSFVRAQWAKKPMLWHIYPQTEETHQIKLNAFLGIYCAALSTKTADTIKEIHAAWNAGTGNSVISPALWQRWLESRPELDSHAENWGNRLLKQEDLCSSLVRFCRSKL